MYVNLYRFIVPGTGAVTLALKYVVSAWLFDKLLVDYWLLNFGDGRADHPRLLLSMMRLGSGVDYAHLKSGGFK